MENKGQDRLDRHLELSGKLIEMGQALIKEGKENSDYNTTQVGNFLVLSGGLILEQEDVFLFAQLCSMFSAKKILDRMERNKVNIDDHLIKKDENESHEDFINRINKLRKDNGLGPINSIS